MISTAWFETVSQNLATAIFHIVVLHSYCLTMVLTVVLMWHLTMPTIAHLQANKFLPYGFGPGSRTIIEDAGDIDDDEEDYGEYQVT